MGSDVAETTGSLGETTTQMLPQLFIALIVVPAQLVFGIKVI
ncbi:conserved hypothetical protein [Rhodococcus sp. RD6.2]|jgi:hypothetical protein|nr:hypothetical protein [Rhodococcus sp. RD6.2]CRK53330.1 conserved hypothetical protein [Rhodococcus sp. RD6.2]